MKRHRLLFLLIILLVPAASSLAQKERGYTKEVRKEVKKLTKEEWTAPQGSPSIEEQLSKLWELESLMDSTLCPLYITASTSVCDDTYERARERAIFQAQSDIISQMQSKVSYSTESQTSNDSDSTYSVSNTNSQEKLGPPIVVLELKRTTKERRCEALIKIAYKRKT